MRFIRLWLTLALTLSLTLRLSSAVAQTTLPGSSLALRSTGSAQGSAWTLNTNGYLGTYIQLTSPAPLSFAITASGTISNNIWPRLTLSIADYQQSFTVSTTSPSSYQFTTPILPAGTYFLRTQLDNNYPGYASPSLTVHELTVTGGTVVNSHTDALALAAADTYIDNFRKGPATLYLPGVAPGTSVQVKLTRHAFNFGANIHGSSDTGLLNPNPTPGTNAYNYQQFINTHFNAVVPSNAGKWDATEPTQDVVSMAWVDKIVNYALQNNMRVRMHNLIWGNQQPSWVNTLINSAASGDQNAKTILRQEISERIDYYVRQRAARYVHLDVYNESVHTGVNQSASYWNIYGPAGISEIYRETAQAVADAGAVTRLYVNEYNVLQAEGGDSYANWYRSHIETIQAADGNPFDGPVSGIGIQYYATNDHSPATMMAALQNLSVLGLPIALTEFGVQSSVIGTSRRVQIVTESLRMIFGTPAADTFMYWGWWQGATSSLQSGSVLVSTNWTLTTVGQAWLNLMNSWKTDLNLVVQNDQTVSFTGFFGDYQLIVDGQSYTFSLNKRGENFFVLGPPPLLLGDTNGDGVVDLADYNNVVNNLGARGLGDTNIDGIVDLADYNNVVNNLGATRLGGAGVPEPASLWVIGVLAAGLAAGPRRECYK